MRVPSKAAAFALDEFGIYYCKTIQRIHYSNPEYLNTLVGFALVGDRKVESERVQILYLRRPAAFVTLLQNDVGELAVQSS